MEKELEQLRREVQALRIVMDFFIKSGPHLNVNYYPDFTGHLKDAVVESEKIRKGE